MCLGIPGKITEITDEKNTLAKVNISGIKRDVNIACIIDDEHPIEQCVGDWVLVHAGFAMNRVSEEEAASYSMNLKKFKKSLALCKIAHKSCYAFAE